MALDKAVDSAKLNADLTTVANAIRTKSGTSAQLNFPAGFVAAVDAIQTGGPAPVIQALTVTENGTYNVPSGVDGYGPVNVNVAGSGGGSEQLDALIDRSISGNIHSNVTKVGNYAFSECRNITKAHFPLATSIGKDAFNKCYSLQTADFPLLKTIGHGGFNSCDLRNVIFPAVETIEDWGLAQNSYLATVELPKVTTINEKGLGWDNKLTALRLPGPTVCQATGDLGIPSGCQIYVPASLIDQYRTATNWSKYADQFVAIEGV